LIFSHRVISGRYAAMSMAKKDSTNEAKQYASAILFELNKVR